MVSFTFGGKAGRTYDLTQNDDYVVVRTANRSPLRATPLSARGRTMADGLDTAVWFPDAGVEVLERHQVDPMQARAVFKGEPGVRFAGRVLSDPRSGVPVIYTENLFLKLLDDCPDRVVAEVLRRLPHSLTVKRRLPFARNAFFLEAPEGTGQAVFDLANDLLQMPEVEYCHPELVRERSSRAAFPEQWHLWRTSVGGTTIDAHAAVTDAWARSEGEDIVIAVIDDGVDIGHPEFQRPHKIVSPRDLTRGGYDARPFFGDDNHGTACAGVACADGAVGASGVAPRARLMPIRLRSALGSIDEADAFYWAGKYGADVISCSWGPVDGPWWDPNHPLHNHVAPLPDSTRLAIDAAIAHGRNGRGCVITWAAGNGNESVDNDGYASYGPVIAVAACNDQGTRSAYSDFGDAIWCSFPSNHGLPSLTPGIWTTDRVGSLGYNPGFGGRGDPAGLFTNSFGGTSSACPGAAGVAALILARNPDLRWDEVRSILRDSCDKIDPTGGSYNSDGRSPLYGYGRLNAASAVELAGL